MKQKRPKRIVKMMQETESREANSAFILPLSAVRAKTKKDSRKAVRKKRRQEDDEKSKRQKQHNKWMRKSEREKRKSFLLTADYDYTAF